MYYPLNTIISQRLKLGCQDFDNLTMDEKAARILMQDTDMTTEQAMAKVSTVKTLTKVARSRVDQLKTTGKEKFRLHIKDMNLSATDLTVLLVAATDPLLRHLDNDHIEMLNLSESMVNDIHNLKTMYYAGINPVYDENKLIEMLSCVLTDRAVIDLAEGENPALVKPVDQTISDFAPSELAASSLVKMAQLNQMPDSWKSYSQQDLTRLYTFVRSNPQCRWSDDLIIDTLTDTLITTVLHEYSESKLTQSDINESSVCISDRQLLAVAAMLNLKATGKLDEPLSKLSDDDLATATLCCEELNYYFDKLAQPSCPDAETLWDIVGNLIAGGLLIVVAAVSGLLSEVFWAVLFGFCAFAFLVNAIATASPFLFPAGIGETRVGVACKAGIRRLKRLMAQKTADATRKLCGFFRTFKTAASSAIADAKNALRERDAVHNAAEHNATEQASENESGKELALA